MTLVFAVHGMLFASWTAHIPEVKRHLELSDGTLGLALVGAPLGSVCAMVFTGPLIARAGSRATVRVTLVGYCLSGPLIGLARSVPEFFVALAVWGAFQGALDVSMNAQGVAAERAGRRPIMSSLHGFWSIGAFAGAGLGAGGVALGLPLAGQLALLGVPCLLAALWSSGRMVDDEPAPADDRRTGSWFAPLLVLLGAIAFAGMVCEGAVADWTAVYLRETLDVEPGVAGLGYAAFAAAMVSVRLAGTYLQSRTPPRLLVAVLAAAGAVGMAAGLLIAHPVAAIVGFAVLGIGLASVIPVVFSAAGNQPGISPGTGIATVSAIGWTGFMCGPAVIGLAAERTSQPLALALIPVLTLLIAVTAWRTSALDHATHA
ncbi:MFS transporter [Spirillospora sp. CA-294931]|uniref:MFS transporter n=1 Tax=Spirillospora sp. CA-294931 TaxID=3240042 RepID=UPI003D8FE799